MSPQTLWFGGLYLAWGLLLAVTGLIRRDQNGSRACWLAALAFLLLGANLAAPADSLLRWIIRLVAWGLLIGAFFLAIRGRQQE